MPPLYVATDRYATKWQKRFLIAQKTQLISLIAASVGSGTAWIIRDNVQVSAAITLTALVVALFTKIFMIQFEPEKKWYNGRAAAESIKTITWKYTQCAKPFDKGLSQVSVIQLFNQRIEDVLKMVPTLNEPSGIDTQFTSSMQEMRKSKLSQRMTFYKKHRLTDQINWYRTKSKYNMRKSYLWSISVLIFEFIAIIFAVLRLFYIDSIDFSGIIATAAAAILSWVQSKQFETLSQSYAVTSHELAKVNTSLNNITTEEKWSLTVEQGEEAISREHTLWVASHR